MKPHTHHRKHWTVLALVTISVSALLSATPQLNPEGASEIAEFIQMDVKADAAMSGANVVVRIDNGVAVLTGKARSLAQTERAAAKAIAIRGVDAVVNQILVTPGSTSEILENAKSALGRQKMLPADDIILSATGARLVLTGKAGTWDEKELAREVISEVPGVVAIENEIMVTFENGREDSQIEEQLRFQTKRDPLCAGLDLTAAVRSGVVRWSGEVGSRDEMDRLARRSRIAGVTDVRVSGLHIDSNLAMEGVEEKNYSKQQSLTALRAALDLDPRIDSKSLRLNLDDGILTLKGDVASLSEKDAAESSARWVPGVLRVSNELEIKGTAEVRDQPDEMKFAAPPPVKPHE